MSHSLTAVFLIVSLLGNSVAKASAGSADEHYFLQAAENAAMANEGLVRSQNLLHDWLRFADPATGLIPRNLYGEGDQSDIWDTKDAAADNFPFLYITSFFTDPDLFEGSMLDMLMTETALTSRLGRIPDDYSFRKKDFLHPEIDMERIIFGAAEYMKDGLIVMTELLGAGPWRSRMTGILDDMLDLLSQDMLIFQNPVRSMEVYGELLQLLSRIYWIDKDEKYLDFAILIGDYYLLGDHHPTRDFPRLRLRDHGGEIIAGLSELYATLHHARPEKVHEYRGPLYEMLDRVLEVGLTQEGSFEHEVHRGVREPVGELPGGLFYNEINPQTGEVLDDRLADTWGYVMNAYYTVYMLDGVERYRDVVRHALSHIPAFQDYNWERGSADGDADAVEGALYLYNREPVKEAAAWMDRQMEIMWSKQDSAHGQRERPEGRWRNRGVVEGWHGDGNFARTSLMHALWKTRGTHVQPWRDDVLLGAATDGEDVYLYLSADQEWSGRLVFDRKRHQAHLNLPMDWPRLNQFCEWFVAEPDQIYTIRDLSTGGYTRYFGQELLNGVFIHINAGEEKNLVLSRLTP